MNVPISQMHMSYAVMFLTETSTGLRVKRTQSNKQVELCVLGQYPSEGTMRFARNRGHAAPGT